MKSILIIDDNQVFRENIAEVLQMELYLTLFYVMLICLC